MGFPLSESTFPLLPLSRFSSLVVLSVGIIYSGVFPEILFLISRSMLLVFGFLFLDCPFWIPRFGCPFPIPFLGFLFQDFSPRRFSPRDSSRILLGLPWDKLSTILIFKVLFDSLFGDSPPTFSSLFTEILLFEIPLFVILSLWIHSFSGFRLL